MLINATLIDDPRHRLADPDRLHPPALRAGRRPLRHVRRRRRRLARRARPWWSGTSTGSRSWSRWSSPSRRCCCPCASTDALRPIRRIVPSTAPLASRPVAELPRRTRDGSTYLFALRSSLLTALVHHARRVRQLEQREARRATRAPPPCSRGTVPNGGTLTIGAEQEPDCFDWLGAVLRLDVGHVDGAGRDACRCAFRDVDEERQRRRACRARCSPACRRSRRRPLETITYNINPTAVWSDGVPITCADFQYTANQEQTARTSTTRTGYVEHRQARHDRDVPDAEDRGRHVHAGQDVRRLAAAVRERGRHPARRTS